MSIRITELDAINSLQDGDYVAVDNESTGTHKFKALDISANLAGNIANTYSSSASYAIGQYCLYNNNLYRCTTTISTPEAWNGAHWVQVTVGEGLYDKVDKVSGKALSANDFTNAYKTKLDGIEAGAEVNVQANWTESDSSKDDYIKNKPVNATTSTSGFMSATDKAKLDSIASGAEVNVQANWAESDSSKDDYIKNKPVIDEALNLSSHNAVRNSTITAGINQVQSNLNTEITNRQNAVSAEQLARENADNALDGRLDTIEETLPNKANIDGSYDSMTVGNAEQLVSNIRVNDKTSYLFRTSGGSVDIGDREYVNGIVGGTVAWNQLCRSILTQTRNGIDCTNNGDGSYTFNGISTARAQFFLNGEEYHINANDKILVCANNISGACSSTMDIFWYFIPDDGSSTQYPSMVIIGSDGTMIRTATIFNMSKSGKMNLNGVLLDFGNANTTVTNFKITPQVYNLTQMFGSTIADYIYSLETANAGAGVAYFKKLFPKPYYAYNTGELKSVNGLVSHDMVGFNAWDEEWEVGGINSDTGINDNNQTTTIRAKNPFSVLPNTTYRVTVGQPPISVAIATRFYDADMNYLVGTSAAKTNQTFATPANAAYMRFVVFSQYGTTYHNDICINISWDGSRDGEYEPYELHSYPLDTDLTLRGIPKLDTNNSLYYDGDVYAPSGTITRRFGVITLDGSNDESWSYDPSKSRFYIGVSDINSSGIDTSVANIISNRYVASTYSRGINLVDTNCITGRNGIAQINIFDASMNGDLTTFKASLASKPLTVVYELAESTEETADAYQTPQIVNDFGTEEYIIDANTFAVPVGHDTDYPINLVSKLEMAPNSPNGDGDYIVRQTNGMNAYVPLVIEDALPTIPSTAGSYKLTVTVADGSDPVLSWEAE